MLQSCPVIKFYSPLPFSLSVGYVFLCFVCMRCMVKSIFITSAVSIAYFCLPSRLLRRGIIRGDRRVDWLFLTRPIFELLGTHACVKCGVCLCYLWGHLQCPVASKTKLDLIHTLFHQLSCIYRPADKRRGDTEMSVALTRHNERLRQRSGPTQHGATNPRFVHLFTVTSAYTHQTHMVYSIECLG